MVIKALVHSSRFGFSGWHWASGSTGRTVHCLNRPMHSFANGVATPLRFEDEGPRRSWLVRVNKSVCVPWVQMNC